MTKTAKGISLNIGLNEVDPAHYEGWSGELNACEFDAEDMQSLAQAQGFETQTLLTAEATRDAVVDRIRNAASTLADGDMFLLTYSGHGGRVKDYNRDEPDDTDETWCLYDGQLIDDELWALWPDFAAGVRIFVLSDSCHSGTVIKVAPTDADPASRVWDLINQAMRSEGVRYRYMPVDVARRVYKKNKDFYDRNQAGLPKHKELLAKLGASVRLISGCQDNQYSMDGAFNGLFTGTLLTVWADGQFSGDYDEFHSEILRRMPPTQSPNHFLVGPRDPAYDAQVPFTI